MYGYNICKENKCSGLYPPSKRWIMPWYYIGIGGTIILIIMYFIAAPGGGYPINPLDVAIETFQIVFVILSAIIIFKHRNTAKVNEKIVRIFKIL
jgi:hypothetical protein